MSSPSARAACRRWSRRVSCADRLYCSCAASLIPVLLLCGISHPSGTRDLSSPGQSSLISCAASLIPPTGNGSRNLSPPYLNTRATYRQVILKRRCKGLPQTPSPSGPQGVASSCGRSKCPSPMLWFTASAAGFSWRPKTSRSFACVGGCGCAFVCAFVCVCVVWLSHGAQRLRRHLACVCVCFVGGWVGARVCTCVCLVSHGTDDHLTCVCVCILLCGWVGAGSCVFVCMSSFSWSSRPSCVCDLRSLARSPPLALRLACMRALDIQTLREKAKDVLEPGT